MKVVTQMNYNHEDYSGRVCETASKTVPDQTMSLRTILDRYARGMPLIGNPDTPVYNGEDSLGVDLRTLDLSERAELTERIADEVKNIRQKHQDSEVAKAKAKQKAELKAELEAEKKDPPIPPEDPK